MAIIIIFGCSGMCLVVAASVAGGVAGAFVLVPLLTIISWFNYQLGIDGLIVGSWEFLSGVNSGGAVAACNPNNHSATFGGLLMLLLALAILLVSSLIGLAAIVGIPGGLLVAAAGGVRAVVSAEKKLLVGGLGILTAALGAMIVSGLMDRLVHHIYQAYSICDY